MFVYINVCRCVLQDVERGDLETRVGKASSASSATAPLGNSKQQAAAAIAPAAAPGSRGDRIGRPRRWSAVVRVLRHLLVAMLLLAASLAALAALWLYMGPVFIVQLVLVAIVAYFVAGGRLRWFYVAIKTAPRDLK